ncbi:MBL fold metallo-hydrolase [Nonomuraea jabiensis]|uniref:Beta-lactamase superfamily II metal-dependent hydrolase n=1 Tax=Nonomuraea jabiensis TaxID=882448 RepID=A0A7W9GE49_9ACTN|nr:MBL fold metallo-hydrolase [Nonomuraea jabiensis]MBB5782130.1 beta-lactamase superfamily II metal-dependent hydrolase [Nonomuraea jabiensis]
MPNGDDKTRTRNPKRKWDDLDFGLFTDKVNPEELKHPRKMARTFRAKQKADAANQARKEAEALRARLALIPTPVPPGGGRGDGNFYLAFVKVGQGDCTVMTTPGGKVILIDCGTIATDNEDQQAYVTRVQGILTDRMFLGNADKLEILILTHPDQDHINQLEWVVPNNVKAHTVYHSLRLDKYLLAQAWVRSTVINEALIKRVDLGPDTSGKHKALLSGVAIQKADATNKIERLDADGGLTIVAEDDCTVTLVAAGVSNDYKEEGVVDEQHTNAASVVTLVEVHGKRILLCGDATFDTENYMIRSGMRDRLRRVDYINAPHHGSKRTSSSQSFVDHVRPREMVVVSAAFFGHTQHHLPSWPVVQRWAARFAADRRPADTTPHEMSVWDLTENRYNPTPRTVAQPVYSTGSHDTQYVVIRKPAAGGGAS